MSAKRGRSLADVMASIDPLPPAEQAAPPLRDIVPVNILVTPRDRKRLRQLSLDTGLSLQKLGHEAWNKLLGAIGASDGQRPEREGQKVIPSKPQNLHSDITVQLYSGVTLSRG